MQGGGDNFFTIGIGSEYRLHSIFVPAPTLFGINFLNFGIGFLDSLGYIAVILYIFF